MLQSPDSPRDALPHPAPTLVHFHEHYLKHLLPALDAAAPPGLTSTQGWILADVAREGDMTAARLAERRQLDPAYLSRTLGEMEEAGLLARRPSIRDGRKRPISLTAAGRAVARQVEASFPGSPGAPPGPPPSGPGQGAGLIAGDDPGAPGSRPRHLSPGGRRCPHSQDSSPSPSPRRSGLDHPPSRGDLSPGDGMGRPL